MLRERQPCLTELGHPWDTALELCWWQEGLSHRGNITCCSEMLLHARSGREAGSGGSSWKDF